MLPSRKDASKQILESIMLNTLQCYCCNFSLNCLNFSLYWHSLSTSEICSALCVPRQSLTIFFFFFLYQITLEAELSQVRDQPLHYYSTYVPLTATELQNLSIAKCPKVITWPSYKLYSTLVSLYDHPLISNLINLFYGPGLPVSDLLKSHLRLCKM